MNARKMARMDGRGWLYLGVLLLGIPLGFGSSLAQAPIVMPSDVDLRASYCIEATKHDIEYYNTVLRTVAPGTESINKVIAESRRGLNLASANLRKLQQYLVPRALYLDFAGLLAASTSANDDVARIVRATNSCPNVCSGKPDPDVCYYGCLDREMPDLKTIQNRFQACRELSWLPL